MNQSLQPAILAVMPQARATGLFRSLATFYAPVQTQGPTGNPAGTFLPVDGLSNIACMDSPRSTARVSAQEQQSEPRILSENWRHVLLDRRYAAVEDASVAGWRVTIDGKLYDLMGAEPSSQRDQTRMELQLAVLEPAA